MTKQDLFDKLNQKYELVLDGETQESMAEDKMVNWAVPVYDFEGDVVTRKWVHYWEDTDTGEFYWKNSEPKPTRDDTPSFRDKVEAEIRDRVEAGTIEYGDIQKTDREGKRALVKAVKSDGTEIKVVVTEDSGTFNFKILK